MTKILITGDISTNNISNFDIRKLNKKYYDLISNSDLVIFNLEGCITPSESFAKNTDIMFRENKLLNFIFKKINLINIKIRNKPQRKVYSNKKILSLLKINKKTLVTLANNHIKDIGNEGFKYTLQELDRNYVNYIGAGIDKNTILNFYEFKDIVFINLNFVGAHKLGLSLHLYSATKKSFGSAYINFNNLGTVIKKLKNKNKKVVLILHSGKELPQDYDDINIDFKSISNLETDLTIIHHPHIYIKTKWEKNNIFILGDFIYKSKNKNLKTDRDTAIIELSIIRSKLKVNLVKTKVNKIYED